MHVLLLQAYTHTHMLCYKYKKLGYSWCTIKFGLMHLQIVLTYIFLNLT